LAFKGQSAGILHCEEYQVKGVGLEHTWQSVAPQHTEQFVRQLQGILMGGLMFDEAEGCSGATMGERLTAMGERMMRFCGNGRVDYSAP
jgi:hypothetical protein